MTVGVVLRVCDAVRAPARSNNDGLPWLTRRQSGTDHHPDGPSSPPSRRLPSPWLDPNMVVPPPGRGHHRLAGETAADPRSMKAGLHRPRLPAPVSVSDRRATDKFDELDEEVMSPLSGPSHPDMVIFRSFLTVFCFLFFFSRGHA